jgi:hypothetical protein
MRGSKLFAQNDEMALERGNFMRPMRGSKPFIVRFVLVGT